MADLKLNRLLESRHRRINIDTPRTHGCPRT
jgi:hypothetical protein